MVTSNEILSKVKSRVLAIMPEAEIFLFGSRAYGISTEESDWDILILTDGPVNATIKKNIHTSLFPLSVEIGAFINTLTIQKDEWENNPSYYSLHQTVKGRMVQA